MSVHTKRQTTLAGSIALLLSLAALSIFTDAADASEPTIANFTHAGVPVYASQPNGVDCILFDSCLTDAGDIGSAPTYRNPDTIGVLNVSCRLGPFTKIRYATDVPLMWAPSKDIAIRNAEPRQCGTFDLY